MNENVTKAAVLAVAAAIGSVFFLPPDDESSALVDYQRRCTLAQSFHDSYIPKVTNGRMFFTDGESWRPEITALAYAKQGIGIKNSLHTKRLARDKNLVVNGKVSFAGADYQLAGEIWEAIGPAFGVQTAWGGRFGDSVHFSCAWQGVK